MLPLSMGGRAPSVIIKKLLKQQNYKHRHRLMACNSCSLSALLQANSNKKCAGKTRDKIR